MILINLILFLLIINDTNGNMNNDDLNIKNKTLDDLLKLKKSIPNLSTNAIQIEKCKYIINKNNNNNNNELILDEFYFNTYYFNLLLTKNDTLKQFIKIDENCKTFNLTILLKLILPDDNNNENKLITFVSSKKLHVYFILIVILFVSIVICFYLYKKNENKRIRKSKQNQSSNNFNPFDILKINDEHYKTAKTLNKHNNSCTALLQPSTLDLSQMNSELKIDAIDEVEGDTRSEYSITDLERMKYVQQWIESLTY